MVLLCIYKVWQEKKVTDDEGYFRRWPEDKLKFSIMIAWKNYTWSHPNSQTIVSRYVTMKKKKLQVCVQTKVVQMDLLPQP